MEILLVSSLVAMVSLALFGTLNNALKIWQRARKTVLEQDIVVFFDKISGDLHNAVAISTLPFEGSVDRMQLPTMVFMEMDSSGSRASEGWGDQPGRVQYRFDSLKGVVVYSRANYSQASAGVFGLEEVLLTGIDRISFEYLYASTEMTGAGGLPAGVDIEVAFQDDTGGRTMRRFIPIPVGM
jgi:hypothetical protein